MKPLFFLLAIFVTLTACRQPAIIDEKIIGKWLLLKHTVKGDDHASMAQSLQLTYEFLSDSTFIIKVNGKEKGEIVHKGKWEIIPAESKIRFYEISVTDQPEKTQADQFIIVEKLSATELLAEELLFSETISGLSFYKKQ